MTILQIYNNRERRKKRTRGTVNFSSNARELITCESVTRDVSKICHLFAGGSSASVCLFQVHIHVHAHARQRETESIDIYTRHVSARDENCNNYERDSLASSCVWKFSTLISGTLFTERDVCVRFVDANIHLRLYHTRGEREKSTQLPVHENKQT
jgi:hypothetical protein